MNKDNYGREVLENNRVRESMLVLGSLGIHSWYLNVLKFFNNKKNKGLIVLH